jgi:lipopolysaccharide transport system permease protein
MEIRHYSPNNNKTFGQIINEITEGFMEGRELASRLFVRDLKASFRKSFLGFFWMFIPPLATTLIWIFLSSQKVVSIQKTPME